jgi:endonuclease-8
MPEGDTIYRAARALNQALAGRVVTGFETGLGPIARVNDDTPLAGRTVERVESRGKWCLMHFSASPAGDEPLILVTHMLMSGSWHIYRLGERWQMPRRAMRVVVRVGAASSLHPTRSASPHGWGTQADDGNEADPTHAMKPREWGTQSCGYEAVAFNVPIVEFHTAKSLERSSQVPKLGPDVLGKEFTAETGAARLQGYAREHPEAEVGVALLNQRVLAGLGNVYKSEVAFAAQVNPWRAMGSLSGAEIARLAEFALRYMRANVTAGKGEGVVTYTGLRRTTGQMDTQQRLWVYRRQRQECRRCGARILMRKQGTQARSTYWCPECQW